MSIISQQPGDEKRQEEPDAASLRESSPSGKATGCVDPTTGHCGKGRAKKTLKGPGLPAVRAGGRERNRTEDFQGRESALCDPIRRVTSVTRLCTRGPQNVLHQERASSTPSTLGGDGLST